MLVIAGKNQRVDSAIPDTDFSISVLFAVGVGIVQSGICQYILALTY